MKKNTIEVIAEKINNHYDFAKILNNHRKYLHRKYSRNPNKTWIVETVNNTCDFAIDRGLNETNYERAQRIDFTKKIIKDFIKHNLEIISEL